MKLTRRQWLQLGVQVGIGGALFAAPGSTLIAGEEGGGTSEGALTMAVIPSSGEAIPAVGIGTVDFQGGSDMGRLRETLATFHRLGGRVIDTSPNYGDSEAVLGRLLTEAGLTDQVFMATKVDRETAADGVERMKSSFQRLDGHIDLMQVHNLRGVGAQLPTLLEWKAAGRFKYVGVTTHRTEQHAAIEQLMRDWPLDFVQVNYSLADRAAADRLLPLAQERGVAVLVNRPFGKGSLFSATRGQELPAWAADIDAASWGQVFLKYVISHPAATIPIPGTSKPHHIEDNLGALRGRLPDAAQRRDMERWFDSHA